MGQSFSVSCEFIKFIKARNVRSNTTSTFTTFSSHRASKRRKSATVYENTGPVKVHPDALMEDIVSIMNEVKAEPLETAFVFRAHLSC